MRTVRTALVASIVVGLLSGSVVVMAQEEGDEAVAASPFSGSFAAGPGVPGGYSPTVREMTDPRLHGTVFWSSYSDIVDDVDVFWQTFRIVTDDGAWQGSFLEAIARADEDDDRITTGMLVGEGAYEGLVAITALDSGAPGGWAIEGFIMQESSIPEPPPAAGTQ